MIRSNTSFDTRRAAHSPTGIAAKSGSAASAVYCSRSTVSTPSNASDGTWNSDIVVKKTEIVAMNSGRSSRMALR